MSKKDFLLEIGLEEIPARFVDGAIKQLEEKMIQWLSTHKISFDQVIPYATPRRLALLVQGMAEKQEDVKEEAKGPAKKIALDDEGNWSKAAQGFARSQGVSTDEFYFKELKGVEYIFVTKEQKGVETRELLPQLQELILGLNFPKNMRWGSYEQKFVRPLRWLIALFGEELIPFSITNIETNRISAGHRFLGKSVQINEPKDYASVLREEFVIASVEERKSLILSQIDQLAKEKGWNIPIDQDLLAEVVHLVEYPTALYGSFDPDYLQIPQEVLITSMKENQRYFPVQDQNGQLLPYFVTVRNGVDDPQGIVVKGNEKVLRARLADARFFYEEDKKLKIDQALSKLESVVFHEELGTIGDKIRRIREVALKISDSLKLAEGSRKLVERTATICKFDLVSQMVYEFPELQGRMGQEYALLAGEKEEVANGIFEHYLPRFAGDRLPASEVGAVVSVADKLDSIIGSFGIGIVPTGSQDPYGLRRQASGIVQIILDRKWNLSLEELFSLGLETMQTRNLMKREEEDVLHDLETFFFLRMKNRMQEQGIRYDIIDAILENKNDRLDRLFARAEVLSEVVDNPEFKQWVETFTRVNNLASKKDGEYNINTQLFEKDVEHQLYTDLQKTETSFTQFAKDDKWKEALKTLAELKPSIDAFFDQIMVMVEEEEIRNNRLALLNEISVLIRRFADFSKIVFA